MRLFQENSGLLLFLLFLLCKIIHGAYLHATLPSRRAPGKSSRDKNRNSRRKAGSEFSVNSLGMQDVRVERVATRNLPLGALSIAREKVFLFIQKTPEAPSNWLSRIMSRKKVFRVAAQLDAD